MARAVSPWLHRILIRDHGPRDPMTKLVLYTLNACMRESGSCWHSQESIAAAASMGESTVRRKIIEANLAHWIAVSTRAPSKGHKWNRQYIYYACCPDSIDLAAIPCKGPDGDDSDCEELALRHEANHGLIDARSLTGSQFKQPGSRRRVPPAASGSSLDVPPASSGSSLDVPPANDESTAHSGTIYRSLRTNVPPAAALEGSFLSTNVKYQCEEGASRPAVGGSISESGTGLRKPIHVSSLMIAEDDEEVKRRRRQAEDHCKGANQ